MTTFATYFPTYFPPTHLGGDIVNVKNPIYGALGNSTDGTDGADDSDAIQAAVDALGLNAGTVFFPPGKYRITKPIKLNNNGDNKSIILLGCGKASQIVGNFDGYLIDKGMVRLNTNASTSTSSNVLHMADTSTIGIGWTIINRTTPASLPYPSYRVGSKTSTTVTMVTVDDTTPINAAATVGNGDELEFIDTPGGDTQYVRKVSQLYLDNENTTAGGCLRLVGSWPAEVRDCLLKGFIGITADVNSVVDVANCKISGVGGSGGYGISVGGECTVYKCDITGMGGAAIIASGAGGAVIGCRAEINAGYGIFVNGASGWLFSGNSLEGNGGGIYANGTALAVVGGHIHGEEENGSFAGLTIPVGGGCNFSKFGAFSISGTFGTATPSATTGHATFVGFGCQGLVFEAVVSTATGGHGLGWMLHAEDCTQFSGCNQPAPASAPYSSKPGTTGGGPMEGDLHTFTDVHATDAVWGGTVGASGTGSAHCEARYSSRTSSWRVVAPA